MPTAYVFVYKFYRAVYYIISAKHLSQGMACNVQVLPMVGNFLFVRPEPLLGFLIKLNIKN